MNSNSPHLAVTTQPSHVLDLSHKVFVPHSEELQQTAGVLGELVPFDLEYDCVRLLDGTYDFVAKRQA